MREDHSGTLQGMIVSTPAASQQQHPFTTLGSLVWGRVGLRLLRFSNVFAIRDTRRGCAWQRVAGWCVASGVMVTSGLAVPRRSVLNGVRVWQGQRWSRLLHWPQGRSRYGEPQRCSKNRVCSEKAAVGLRWENLPWLTSRGPQNCRCSPGLWEAFGSGPGRLRRWDVSGVPSGRAAPARPADRPELPGSGESRGIPRAGMSRASKPGEQRAPRPGGLSDFLSLALFHRSGVKWQNCVHPQCPASPGSSVVFPQKKNEVFCYFFMASGKYAFCQKQPLDLNFEQHRIWSMYSVQPKRRL